MLTPTPNGLYSPDGDFYIDPVRPVKQAIITHGHADHARWGMGHYIATPETCDIMTVRLGKDISTTRLPYNKPISLRKTTVQLVPAGHILGSAQVVIDSPSGRAVVTGDFKVDEDSTVDSFEPVPCDLLVMETTFALPIYNWPSITDVLADIHAFWRKNQAEGVHTVLYAYSLGKAQRLLAGLDQTQGPIAVHSAVANMNDIYVKNKRLLSSFPVFKKTAMADWSTPGLVVAPPATIGSRFIKMLGAYREAYVSGWMLGKGQVRRRNMRGFVVSDHADWAGLNATVSNAKPRTIWTMHGFVDSYARYLREQGMDACALTKLQVERSE